MAAHKFRETLDQKFSSLVHTVYQHMMGVVYMVKRLNLTRGSKVTVPQLVELYQKNVGTSSGAEVISKDFIDTSLTM